MMSEANEHSNANIEGLSEDLGITGQQYNTALAIFFVPYIVLGRHRNVSRLLLRK